jgi:hypothetical protein
MEVLLSSRGDALGRQGAIPAEDRNNSAVPPKNVAACPQIQLIVAPERSEGRSTHSNGLFLPSL